MNLWNKNMFMKCKSRSLSDYPLVLSLLTMIPTLLLKKIQALVRGWTSFFKESVQTITKVCYTPQLWWFALFCFSYMQYSEVQYWDFFHLYNFLSSSAFLRICLKKKIREPEFSSLKMVLWSWILFLQSSMSPRSVSAFIRIQGG